MKIARFALASLLAASVLSAMPAFAAEPDGKCGNLPTVTQRVDCIRGLSTKPSPSSPSSLESSPASSERVRPIPVARTPSTHEDRPTGKQSKVQRAPASGDSTCHTGPRGGTYTITASGRKNYSGC